MRIGAAGSAGGELPRLLDQIIPAARTPLENHQADLGLVFATSHFEDEVERIGEQVRAQTGARVLLGCTGEGVIGPQREYEQEPAVALWLAHLPGSDLRPFHLSPPAIESATNAVTWRHYLQIAEGGRPSLLLLGDPFTLDVNGLFEGINQHLPGCVVIGGMASGVETPGQTRLLLDDQMYGDGAVGVAVSGDVTIATVVSQGCRPVGRPWVITRAERNVIYQLGGRKPLELLQQIYEEAPEKDRKLMQQGLFLGRAINEHLPEFRRGDFLIRNLMGVDQESGAIALGDHVRVGITVQFHVRDAASADEDLHSLLAAQATPAPAGALLLSCNGRGTRMFDQRDHDVRVASEALGRPPIAGFFCGGELGPVGGKNFIHGHTASMALFRPAVG